MSKPYTDDSKNNPQLKGSDHMRQSPFIDLRRRLHQIPEPGFEEWKTQALILQYLQELPAERLEIKTWQTGILVRIPGKNPKQTIAYRTDMDGLPIEEETSYAFQSIHPGYMHACGHDMHMAIALGILTHFVHHPIDDHLLFLFQPAEEGPGGALPLLQSPAFQAWKPDAIFALHIAPEYPVGTVATRPGILFANTSEVNIQLIGNSGHAAMPHKANDMMIAAAQLVMQLQTIVSRNIDPLDAVILTLGKLVVGSKENIISGKAEINGTIRSLSHENMQLVKKRIKQITAGIGESFQCETAVDWGINYLQVDNHPEITRHFMNWVQQHEKAKLIECREAMTGEDFGYFLEQIPGMMFWLGVDTLYGLHHSKIEPKEEAIPFAIDLLTGYLRHYAQQCPQKEEPLLQ